MQGQNPSSYQVEELHLAAMHFAAFAPLSPPFFDLCLTMLVKPENSNMTEVVRVTVHGRNAVVVVATDEFDRLRAQRAAGSLHELLSGSPLNRLDFGGGSVRSPVREIDL